MLKQDYFAAAGFWHSVSTIERFMLINALYPVIGFLVAIGILVIVHEFGHYIAAVAFRVKVLRFSIGFGPVLARFKAGKDQTEWAISAIPLGGYVKMLDDGETEEDKSRGHNHLHPAKKIIISAAGPMANFIFALIVIWILSMIGTREILPVIDAPAPQTPAYQAGLQAGDKIVRLANRPVHTWQDLAMSTIGSLLSQQNTEIVVTRDDQIKTFQLDLSQLSFNPDESRFLDLVGLSLQRPVVKPVINKVTKGSPADKAGLKAGDRILLIDQTPVYNWLDLVEMVKQRPNQQMTFIVDRQGQQIPITITSGSQTVDGKTIGLIGVSADLSHSLEKLVGVVRLTPLDALSYSMNQIGNNISLTFRFLGSMLSGKISSSHLSGPIAIADSAGQSAKMGVDQFFKFLALISVGLGTINLLPVPILDGGHLMYHCLEWIRGKPLSLNQQVIGQLVGLVFVVVLTVFLLYNDISRYFFG